MTQTLNISADGQITINFGATALSTDVSDALLPPGVSAMLQEIYADLSGRGLSEIHLERDGSRSFRHEVKAGVVSQSDLSPLERFDAIMASQDAIIDALSPQPQLEGAA